MFVRSVVRVDKVVEQNDDSLVIRRVKNTN